MASGKAGTVQTMADKLIGGLFAKARNATRRRYVASAGDVGRLMRLFHGTIEALATAQESDRDAFEVVDEVVGWAKLLRVRGEVEDLANLAEEDPLLRAADRWRTLRKFAHNLLEALEFRATRAGDPMLAALKLVAELNRSGRREVPTHRCRKDWRRLVMDGGTPGRRLYETAVLATLRDRLRSGDIWVERSSNYRRFDSYLLPVAAVPAVAEGLGLPATAEAWLATRATELDQRLKRFARRLQRDGLEGGEFRDRRLRVLPTKATTTPEARAFADRIEAMMPRVRITELLHEVNGTTGFASAFTNLRTGEHYDDVNALLAAILADATNLGLGRMAAASHGCQSAWKIDPRSASNCDPFSVVLVPVVHRGTRALRSAQCEADAATRGRFLWTHRCKLGQLLGRSGPVLEAPAVVAGLNDVAVVREAIQQRCGHFGIAKHARPLAEGEICGDDHRCTFVETADGVEQQLSADLGERQVAELIEDDEVEPGEEVSQPALTPSPAFGLETIDEVDGIEEASA
jgi:hypothetical protein